MNKRYQVFVSSTFRDLQAARAQVLSALLNAEYIPTGMEQWPADNDEAWEVISAYLRECDYYVLIVAGRYGTMSKKTGLSFTEMEYNKAVELKIPVLAFLHADPGKLLADNVEAGEEAKAKLSAFVERVRDSHTVDKWSNEYELESKVMRALSRATRDKPRTGWIRADQAVDPRVASELADARRLVEQLEDQLQQSRTQPPRGSEGFMGLDDPVTVRVRQNPKNNSATKWVSFTLPYREAFVPVGFRAWPGAATHVLGTTLATVLTDRAGPDESNKYYLSMDHEDTRDLLMQLHALGLLAATGQTDDGTVVWTLTEYGRHVLINTVVKKRQTTSETQ